MKIRIAILLAVMLVLPGLVPAAELGEVAYRQAVKDLGNPFRLMCVAAHPDDEDGATLAYYRMLHGVKTTAVIATRGEGGQNEIGPELYNELGVIRTREMREAADITGADLYFLDLPEFGYSKSAEETFEIWGREVALERMVRAIRETRPHVIITNHGRRQDHGHHQAIGAIVREAFSVAADGERFPEHLREGLEPWQVSRLYIRDFRGEDGSVATNISALEPTRGKTIAEIAASALEVHESQGMAYFIDLLLSSRHQTYYSLVENQYAAKGAARAATVEEHGALFAGLEVDTRVPAVEGLPGPEDREAVKTALFAWLKDNAALAEGTADERARWREVNQAAAVASDLRLRAEPDDVEVTPGQQVTVKVNLDDFEESDAISAEVALEERHGLGSIGRHRLELPLHQNPHATGEFTFTIPETAEVTRPLAPRLFEPDFLAPQLAVHATVYCHDAKLELEAPIYLDVAPPLSLSFPDGPYLLRTGESGPLSLNLLVTNNMPGAHADSVTISPPSGWEVTPERAPVSLSREGEQRIARFTLTPPDGLAAGSYEARAGVMGAPLQSAVAVRAADLAVPAERRAGVIQSYDTTFVNTLEKLGVPHETLALADYRPDRLDEFDTIIVDIRAYQYRPDLVANNAALLDYVHRGGTLLVMYQKTFDWEPEYAPYPISLSRNRVTREDAPVTILEPDHPLFTTPNTIRESDWAGWIQERGLYFPDSWHDNYTPLVEVQDPGEAIPPGSVLVAEHGQGTYLYTALGWYRQLRALHPGALRCFANMLAL